MHTPETNQAAAGTPEVTIEKLVYGGSGLARLDGQVVFVPFVLPGETVRAEIHKRKAGLLEGRSAEVLAPSPRRVPAPCPFFHWCGGCQYQHAAYEYQLEQKLEILVEVLRRVGKIEAPPDVRVVAGEPWQYRNRTQFHLDRGRIGYFEFGTHKLCPVDTCPISSPRVNETLTALIEMMRDRRFPRFIRSLEVFTNEAEVQLNVLETEGGQRVSRVFFDWCAERIPGAAAGSLDYAAAGEVFRVSHGSFFQVNRYLTERLVDAALEGAEGETALDLYAGAGLFSLPLARRFAHVVSVESGASAARDLEFNASRAGLAIETRRSSTESFLENLETAPDFVLADPPRAGLGKYAVRELLRLKPARLTIVACDPATLARDLAPLLNGGYRLDGLTLIDLFPQTFHIETAAKLVKA